MLIFAVFKKFRQIAMFFRFLSLSQAGPRAASLSSVRTEYRRRSSLLSHVGRPLPLLLLLSGRALRWSGSRLIALLKITTKNAKNWKNLQKTEKTCKKVFAKCCRRCSKAWAPLFFRLSVTVKEPRGNCRALSSGGCCSFDGNFVKIQNFAILTTKSVFWQNWTFVN